MKNTKPSLFKIAEKCELKIKEKIFANNAHNIVGKPLFLSEIPIIQLDKMEIPELPKLLKLSCDEINQINEVAKRIPTIHRKNIENNVVKPVFQILISNI